MKTKIDTSEHNEVVKLIIDSFEKIISIACNRCIIFDNADLNYPNCRREKYEKQLYACPNCHRVVDELIDKSAITSNYCCDHEFLKAFLSCLVVVDICANIAVSVRKIKINQMTY